MMVKVKQPVPAESVAKELVITGVNLHADHGIYGFLEGGCREQIGFGELATEGREQEKNKDNHCFIVMEG